jgi:hypothetical protein
MSLRATRGNLLIPNRLPATDYRLPLSHRGIREPREKRAEILHRNVIASGARQSQAFDREPATLSPRTPIRGGNSPPPSSAFCHPSSTPGVPPPPALLVACHLSLFPSTPASGLRTPACLFALKIPLLRPMRRGRIRANSRTRALLEVEMRQRHCRVRWNVGR